MRGWSSYFTVLVWAYSELDEHEKAMEAAQQYRETYGDDPGTLGYEGFALAALGRVEELNALLDDLVALPEQSLSVGTSISRIASYLRRHGHTDAAQTTIDRAIEWYEARPPETKSGTAWRGGYSWALYVADRWEEAYSVAKPLSEEFPENMNYRALVGILAACRGDQEEALETSERLEALDRPYLRGWNTIWRALIAGALGDGESAVALWRQALGEGFPHRQPWARPWIALEPIRDYPPFQELMRPKG
jgi:tetratricopeptide (TPR) repeat protein